MSRITVKQRIRLAAFCHSHSAVQNVEYLGDDYYVIILFEDQSLMPSWGKWEARALASSEHANNAHELIQCGFRGFQTAPQINGDRIVKIVAAQLEVCQLVCDFHCASAPPERIALQPAGKHGLLVSNNDGWHLFNRQAFLSRPFGESSRRGLNLRLVSPIAVEYLLFTSVFQAPGFAAR